MKNTEKYITQKLAQRIAEAKDDSWNEAIDSGIATINKKKKSLKTIKIEEKKAYEIFRLGLQAAIIQLNSLKK